MGMEAFCRPWASLGALEVVLDLWVRVVSSAWERIDPIAVAVSRHISSSGILLAR